MIVTIPFPAYDKRTLGRPWGSKVVTWPQGQPAQTEFHDYVPTTDGAPHLGGEVRLNVIPGDIVRWGQKVKIVGPGAPTTEYPWGIVLAEGTVRQVDQGGALAHYREINGGQPSGTPGPRRFGGGRNPRAPYPSPIPAPMPVPAPPPQESPQPTPDPAEAADAPDTARPPSALHIKTLEQRELLEAALRAIIDPVETALVTAEGFRERARRIARNALQAFEP